MASESSRTNSVLMTVRRLQTRLLIGAAIFAAPIVSSAQVNQGSTQLLLQIQSLQREVAELRDRIDRQEYEMRKLRGEAGNVQQTSPVGGTPIGGTNVGNPATSTGTVTNVPVAPPSNSVIVEDRVLTPTVDVNGQPYQNQAPANAPATGNNTAGWNTGTAPAQQQLPQQSLPQQPVSQQPVSAPVPVAPTGNTTVINPAPVNNTAAASGTLRAEDRVLPGQTNPQPSAQTRLLQDGDRGIQTNMAEQELYNKGIGKLKQQQYEQAVSLFNSQLQAYPRGSKAADAYYWVGESLYILGKLDTAKKSYNSILNRFPNSNRTSSALFKIAVIEDEQGNEAAAKATVQSLLGRFPGSPAAQQAKARFPNLL